MINRNKEYDNYSWHASKNWEINFYRMNDIHIINTMNMLRVLVKKS